MNVLAEIWVTSDADNAELERRLAPLPKRWLRYSPHVRAGFLAVGQALREAEAAGWAAQPTRAGCMACGLSGCHEANRAYFADYLAGGRALGRSALFINTLPTAPLAEYALHFGLGGPLFYALPEDGRLADALALAEAALAQDGVDMMLLLLNDGRRAGCLALTRGGDLSPTWQDFRLE